MYNDNKNTKWYCFLWAVVAICITIIFIATINAATLHSEQFTERVASCNGDTECVLALRAN